MISGNSKGLKLEVGALNPRSGRRLVKAIDGKGCEVHRDAIDANSAAHRQSFAESVAAKSGEPTDDTGFIRYIGQQIILAADTLDCAAQTESFAIERMTSAEFDRGDYSPVWLIENLLHAREQMVIAAPMKGMKTTITTAMAVHLALGKPLFGTFAIPRPVNTLLFSGESGWGTLQGLARRVAYSLGHRLSDCSRLFWSKSLPTIGNLLHHDALVEAFRNDEIEVCIIDPLYFCLPGQDAGNLMIMGSLLRSLSKLCEENGVTLVVVHHVKKSALNPNDPPELSDVSWSGTAEWARQWMLLSRREPYEAGSGLHKLWMSVGGSAGHGSLWGLDLCEGVYPDKVWEPTLLKPEEVLEAKADDKESAKEAKRQEQVARDRRLIVQAALTIPDRTGTKTAIRNQAGISSTQFERAFGESLRAGDFEPCQITQGNNRTYEAYRLLVKEN